MTTLPDLLEKARALAAEGHVDRKECDHLAISLSRAQDALRLATHAKAEYAEDHAGATEGIDGRGLSLEHWQAAEALLGEAEETELEAMENLQALTAELRRMVALGLHAKAKAARAEVRA